MHSHKVSGAVFIPFAYTVTHTLRALHNMLSARALSVHSLEGLTLFANGPSQVEQIAFMKRMEVLEIKSETHHDPF